MSAKPKPKPNTKRKRKRGAPVKPGGPRPHRLSLCVNQAELDALDDIRRVAGLVRRADAVRWLIGQIGQCTST